MRRIPNPSAASKTCLALGRLAALSIATALQAQIAPSDQGVRYRTDRFIAKPSVELEASNRFITNSGARIKKVFPDVGYIQVIEVPKLMTVEQAVSEYASSGKFEYVEPDYIGQASLSPNDTYYNLQWAFHNSSPGGDIHAEDAWAIRNTVTNHITAVIDSGVLITHEDLVDNL